MTKNMELVVKMSFSKEYLVTDRFHVVKLAIEFLQHIIIKKRWGELYKENKAIEQAYKHTLEFKFIYKNTVQLKALEIFNLWIEDAFVQKLETFYTTSNTVKSNFENILNLFIN